MDRTCMVAIRNTMPRIISTKGPAKERRRGGSGGGTAGGTVPGVITGLDMVHLTRGGRLVRIRRSLRWRNIRWNVRRKVGRGIRWNGRRYAGWNAQRPDMSAGGSIALHQLHHSNDQQDGRPSSVKSHARNAIEQEKYSQSNQHCRTHELASAAVFALAAHRSPPDQAPVFGEQPYAEEDQNEGPETFQTKLKEARSVQEEKHPQANENGSSRGNLGSFEFLAGAKGLRQAEWVGCGLSRLNGFGAANRVDDLVDVEKSDRNSEDHDYRPRKIRTNTEDKEHHDHQVRPSFGVLAGIDRSNPDGKDSRENSSNPGIGANVDWLAGSGCEGHSGRIHRLCRRNESGSGHCTLHACRQARLAVNHSANIAGALVTKWLAAGAAEGHGSSIWGRGAIHANLLSVVTDTTGRSQRGRDSDGDEPTGALARMSWLSAWL